MMHELINLHENCMNMLNLVNFELENRLLLVLKPKPQTELNRNIASQKPVRNRFGLLRFFGHPNDYVLKLMFKNLPVILKFAQS